MNIDSSSGFKEWIRGNCLYRCDACAVASREVVTFDDPLDFWRHVQCEHNFSNTEFPKLYPDYCVKKSTIICRYVTIEIYRICFWTWKRKFCQDSYCRVSIGFESRNNNSASK